MTAPDVRADRGACVRGRRVGDGMTVEEIVAQYKAIGEAPWSIARVIVGDLRAAGLLLEAGQRERIVEQLRSCIAFHPAFGAAERNVERDALLRELAGAGEPAPVVDEPALKEPATVPTCDGCPHLREHFGDGEDAHVFIACAHLKHERGERRISSTSRRQPPWCPLLDEPAPPASAPRRMVGHGYGDGPHTKDHDEMPTCAAGYPCRPVEPPTPRRMRRNPSEHPLSAHGHAHDEESDCALPPACQPVAEVWTQEEVDRIKAEGARLHQEFGQPVAPSSPFPEHKCVFETQPPNDTRVYCDCCGTPAPVQHVCVNGLARAWAKEGCATCAKPSSTEAAGPSSECPHEWWAYCGRCKTIALSATQPPHVHQWAAVAWFRNAEKDPEHPGGWRKYHRVTREHCVADGCTEPPATREVLA